MAETEDKPKITVRLAENRVNHSVASHLHIPRLYTPGEKITAEEGFIRFTFFNM